MSVNGSSEELAEDWSPEISPTPTFRQLLSQGVTKNPYGAAIISLFQPRGHLPGLMKQAATDVDHVQLTYNELQQAASRLAIILHGHGVRRESVIACFLPNSVEWVLFCWAAAALEASFAPVDPRLIHRPGELNHILEVLRAETLVSENPEAVEALEKTAAAALQEIKVKIVCNNSIAKNSIAKNSWLGLCTLQDETPLSTMNYEENVASHESLALILFTSGTTSLFKACGHTAKGISASSELYHKVKQIDANSRVLVHSPMFHMAGFWNVICVSRAGATLVVPSASFSPEKIWTAINSQKCTHLPSTPSMISAILNHPSSQLLAGAALRHVSLGADLVAPDLLGLVKDRFGASVVVYSSWGMTEGMGIISWKEVNDVPTYRGILPIGRVMPGARVRICAEDSRDMVRKGQEGEFHVSGTAMTRGYLNGSDDDRFYIKDHIHWHATGDRAMMSQEGFIYILGRNKDIIVRGGENISPAALESCLNRSHAVKSQVVGISDPVAGEVPVAIIKQTNDESGIPNLKSKLQQMVFHDFGPSFALAGVYTLQELGVAEFPTTASGKVRKVELKTLLYQHLQRLQQKKSQHEEDTMINQLKNIWSRILGHSIESDSQLLGDSLTIMRFCYEVEKTCDKRLSLGDVYGNTTVQQQAQLLQTRDASQSALEQITGSEIATDTQMSGEPSIQDMLATFESAMLAERAVETFKTVLSKMNLSWEKDAETIYRNNDMVGDFWSSSQRPSSSNLRWVFEIAGKTTKEVRRALEEALTRHSTLRSICVQFHGQLPVHVVIRPSRLWFDQCIVIKEKVSSLDDLRASVSDPLLGFAGPSRPLCRAIISDIKAKNSTGLVMSVHHSTFDAFSMSAFFQDLESLLSNDKAILSHRTPFKLYADSYHLYKYSPQAREAARHAASRLKGISKHSAALWPIQKGHEWLIGSDKDWTYRDGSPGQPEVRKSFDREDNRPEGVAIYRKESSLQFPPLKMSHNVDASTILKAAVALFNTQSRGQHHALFCNLDSARKWPFLQDWIVKTLPNPLDIAGPTMGCTINILSVNSNETVLDFLRKLQEDQIEQSQYADAPFRDIMGHLSDEEAQIIHDIGRRQIFNWDPTLRTRMAIGRKSLSLIGRQGWLDLGVFWNFGLLDDETLVGFILYDDAHLSNAEASSALERVFQIARWMTTPENWSNHVGDCHE